MKQTPIRGKDGMMLDDLATFVLCLFETTTHREEFTDAVIRVLAQKSDIVYLLWGNPAQTKCKAINGTKNTIIMSSHPSPLGGM